MFNQTHAHFTPRSNLKKLTYNRPIFLILALSFMLTASMILFIDNSHAMSVKRLEKVCEKNFIGANYNPYLEQRCGLLWSQWTFQIIS